MLFERADWSQLSFIMGPTATARESLCVGRMASYYQSVVPVHFAYSGMPVQPVMYIVPTHYIRQQLPPPPPQPPPPQYVHRMRLVQDPPPQSYSPPPLAGAPVHVRVGAAFSPEWTRRTMATAQRASSAPTQPTHNARIRREGQTGLGEPNSVWHRDDGRNDKQRCDNFGQRYRTNKLEPKPPQMRWPRCLRAELRLAADVWGA